MPSATWSHELTTAQPQQHSRSSFLAYPVRYAVSSALRRLSAGPPSAEPLDLKSTSQNSSFEKLSIDPYYTPPRRATPPFQPPPLSPLTLRGYSANTSRNAQLLSRLLAEEIRLLLPPRLQLAENWNLTFSLEQHGASLSTLYNRAEYHSATGAGFVLVVRDGTGSIFGVYLSDPPRPSNGHYYGTGECFLWRASTLPSIPTLASLPPPPSADTTHAQRMTTIGSPRHARLNSPSASTSCSGASTPERLRFKAFPYSGMNDYLIFCEQGFLSVGGGDGHYGLWLDAGLERGVSSACPTFGNEPLSEEGEGGKFEVLGVELWCLGGA